MHALLCDDLWPTIRVLAERPGSRRAAVAYVTSDEYLKFLQDDILVTDASDHAIASGHTSARILQEALSRGARLYSLAGLHAKIMILGDTAVIGSANISHSSTNALIEAAWVTTMSTAVGMVVSLIHQLVDQAEKIDAAFMRRILAIKVEKPPKVSGRIHRTPPILGPSHKTWVVSVREGQHGPDEDVIETGMALANERRTDSRSTTSCMWFSGGSLFRREAAVGDTVIRFWTTEGAKRPFVYKHAQILERQILEDCTLYYVEDTIDCEDTRISVTQFSRLLLTAGFAGKLGTTPVRGISNTIASAMEPLWNSFGTKRSGS